MENILSYKDDKISRMQDDNIISIIQEEILINTPYHQIVFCPEPDKIKKFYETVKEEEIQKAFNAKYMQNNFYLEIMQRCGFAFNEPELQNFISTLIQNKTFFSLSEKGFQKRKNAKEIIYILLNKKLLANLPKKLNFLAQDQFFIFYISELFLPLTKDKIIYSIEKFFELYNIDKDSFYDNISVDEMIYERFKSKLYSYKRKYQKILNDYSSKREYQTKESFLSSIKKPVDIDETSLYFGKEEEKAVLVV